MSRERENTSFCELSLVQTQHSFNPHGHRCYRWVLTPLINSSEDTICTMTFSFPSFPPLSPSVSLPHTLTLPPSLINSPVLSCCLNLSLSLTHSDWVLCSRFLLISTSNTLSSLLPPLPFLFCPISVPHCCPSALKGQCDWHSATVVILTTFCLKWPLKNKRLELSIQSLSPPSPSLHGANLAPHHQTHHHCVAGSWSHRGCRVIIITQAAKPELTTYFTCCYEPNWSWSLGAAFTVLSFMECEPQLCFWREFFNTKSSRWAVTISELPYSFPLTTWK